MVIKMDSKLHNGRSGVYRYVDDFNRFGIFDFLLKFDKELFYHILYNEINRVK